MDLQQSTRIPSNLKLKPSVCASSVQYSKQLQNLKCACKNLQANPHVCYQQSSLHQVFFTPSHDLYFLLICHSFIESDIPLLFSMYERKTIVTVETLHIIFL